jgi:ABC-type Fe3+/spermidine/putrescine transport system ATPase subunit
MNDVPRPLRLEGVTQRYGGSTVLADIALGIDAGEFVTLLGPSGSGKTTLLRIIAGFVRPSLGRVVVEGRDVTAVPPHRRPVNMVFQRSTLFPHLSVWDNVAFGLRIARVPKAETERRVEEALAVVRLEGFGPRRSNELSGGQVQRIALARAIVNRPKVLLFDEPLSALDLNIRLDMEVELRRVHRETGATSVYVTHDQREALALSDRIVVLDEGRIEQVGTPNEIYRAPATPFVARFVGDANVLDAEIVGVDRDRATVVLSGRQLTLPCRSGSSAGPGRVVLRPEVVRLAPGDAEGLLSGVVRDVAFRGSGFTYRIEAPGLSEPVKAEVRAGLGTPFEIGDRVSVKWDLGDCQVLSQRSGAEAPGTATVTQEAT